MFTWWHHHVAPFKFSRLVRPKICLFAHPHIVQNPYDFFSGQEKMTLKNIIPSLERTE